MPIQKAAAISDPAPQFTEATASSHLPAAPVGPPVAAQASGDAEANPGSSVASLWLQVTQEDKPPASIPSTLTSMEQYPGGFWTSG